MPAESRGGAPGEADPERSGHAREGLTYGAGAFAAAGRGDRLMWALHRAALAAGIVPVAPVVALTEGWRQAAQGPEGGGLRCESFAAGVEIEPLAAPSARVLGELGASSGVADQVALAVVETAARRRHAVVTGRSTALGDVAVALDHDLVAHVI